MTSKKERILRMLKNGILSVSDIARVVECPRRYVLQCRWRAERPGYNTEKMRRCA